MSQAEAKRGVPAWLERPLPLNAVRDEALLSRIDELAAELPDSINTIERELQRVSSQRSYDAAVNRASAHVWRCLDRFLHARAHCRTALAHFARMHLPPRARLRVLRRLAKDRDASVRRSTRKIVERMRVNEVAVPASAPRGTAETDAQQVEAQQAEWTTAGWFEGLQTQQLFRRRRINRQLAAALPPLADVAALRELLRIKSPRQLGWMLLASDKPETGPYTSFSIPKRNGASRVICAPKWSLKRVQQRILRNILDNVPVHPAAHGFVRGRSTVTNAQPHCGASLVLKFDLEDFFPTVHYYRVVGLFAGLGFGMATGRFSSRDDSRDVAAALARLCTYARDPQAFADGHLPQGAPTSPAISNLICRRLDARLMGLAASCAGTYTRYADDLTFSFRDPALEVGRFRWWVDQLCHQEGFFVNQGKFRAIRASQRQSVTGIVVNDSLRVPRRERRRFRAMLHNCRKNGIEAEARRRPGLRSYLHGFASYMAMVHPEEGRPLLGEVKALLDGGEAAR